MRKMAKITPMIIDGEPDAIVYDDYDDSRVAASEEEIDAKYPEAELEKTLVCFGKFQSNFKQM